MTTTTAQTTRQVGEGLVGLCKQGKYMEAMDQYYDQNIVSVVAVSLKNTNQSREVKGIAACKQKGEAWHKMVEVHSAKIEGPFLHGEDQFAVYFNYDVTWKHNNQRSNMTEVGVYWVKNGKVTREQFYYTM